LVTIFNKSVSEIAVLFVRVYVFGGVIETERALSLGRLAEEFCPERVINAFPQQFTFTVLLVIYP
jgi:hypothetical protein